MSNSTMKEYSKLLSTEKLLTQELQTISSRLQLPALVSYKTPSCQLKNDLLEVKEKIKGGNIRIIKDKIHDFEFKLSQEKLILTSKCQDASLEQANLSAQVEKLQEIIKNHTNTNNVYQLPIKKEYCPKNIKEEEDYLDFISKTGSTGGWDSVNHSTFISLRQKYSHDLENFYKMCVAKIPGMLISDIQNHDEWYRNYSRLLQNRKYKIQEWKKSKLIQAEKMIQDLENDQLEKDKLDFDTEKQVQKRLKIKKALEEWKISKSLNEVVVPLEDTKKDNSKEIEKRKKIKEKVKAYVGRKNQIQALEKELKGVYHELKKREMDSRYVMENEKFKKRDHDFLERRKQIIHKREKEDFEREKRLQNLVSKVAVHASRDTKRLMQPTIAQNMKVASSDDQGEKVRKKFEAPSIPKRLIPSWRSEL